MSGVAGSRGAAPALAEPGYDGVARAFHWLVVILLLLQYGTKLVPAAWASEDTLNAWHLAIGPTILALMLLRLLWRLTHRPPPPPADLPAGLRGLSRANHWAFYILLIVLPVLGWVSASGFGATPYLLGVVPLPALVSKNEDFAEVVGHAHGVVALLLLAAVALHVTGALYHAAVKRDGVVRRMV